MASIIENILTAPLVHAKMITNDVFGRVLGLQSKRRPPNPKPAGPQVRKNMRADTELSSFARHIPQDVPPEVMNYERGREIYTGIIQPGLKRHEQALTALASIVAGMNRRLGELNWIEDVDSSDPFVKRSEAHSLVKDTIGPMIVEVTRLIVAAVGDLAREIVDTDPDLQASKKTELKDQFSRAVTVAELRAAIVAWRTQSTSMWNRFVASAPQTVGGLAATLIRDSAWISGSPDVRLQALIGGVTGLWIGNDKVTWLANGVIPALKFFRAFMGVPQVLSGTLTPPNGSALVNGNDPSGAVMYGARLTVQVKAAPQLIRTDMDTSFAVVLAELVTPYGTFALRHNAESFRPADLDGGRNLDLLFSDIAAYQDVTPAAFDLTVPDCAIRVTFSPSVLSSNGSFEPTVMVTPRFTLTLPEPPEPSPVP